ncbi:AraC family transcriptional regulator [Pseudomonas sp. G.S.17]|uniref:AraC family transcriptional regulator n=1 Tax=Pseudomonas sp. G.S.17 TaxID=3137451 RepID=UPI00311CAAFE
MDQDSAKRLAAPFFWRDPRLPFIKARSVGDGRKFCYAKHSHEVFSIGAITAGQSTYLHEKTSQRVQTGTVVLMNPGDVHACNPIADQHWSYLMLYVDSLWLRNLQHQLGMDANLDFQPIAQTHSSCVELFRGINQLYATLIGSETDVLDKQCAAVCFFTQMQQTLGSAVLHTDQPVDRVERAAQYINDNFKAAISLDDICGAANISASYLIRAFEQRYHMTPHAYLINRRIQHARTQLKSGRLIADVAQETGFADQAHFQRAFKKHLAATPGQYKL